MTVYEQTNNTLDCMTLVFAFLVWPSALFTMFVVGFKSFKQKEFVAMLPLIVSQLNSALIWSCTACAEVGNFNYKINRTPFLSGDVTDFRDTAIKFFLINAINLEPLTLFLYTWRFIATMEREEQNKSLKIFYRWFSVLSISLLPLFYYCVFIAMIF